MICSKCGTNVEDDSLFCSNCGEKLNVKHCAKCGEVIAEDAKFCQLCGNPVEISVETIVEKKDLSTQDNTGKSIHITKTT